MRTTALVLALVMVIAGIAYGSMATTDHIPPRKNVAPAGTPTYEGRDGGEDIASAVVIPSLPFSDSGNTCPYLDDYDEACPFTGSTSPDVVYSYAPTTTEFITIDLCASLYDTKVFVYEDAETPGAPYACNDDASCGITGYQSQISNLLVFPGHTYHIVVDGYFGDCGDYVLDITGNPSVPCVVDCPPWGLDEGEGVCFDEYADTYNAGCNSDPQSFQSIALNTTICGSSGNFLFGGVDYRDTDWFELVLTEEEHVEFCVCADFPVIVYILDAAPGCELITLVAAEAGPAGYELCVDAVLPAGTYWFFVSTDGWLGVPCGSEYVARLYEFGYTPVEDASWGTLKAMYR